MELEELFEDQSSDSRQRLNRQFTLTDLPRQSVYSRWGAGLTVPQGVRFCDDK